MPEAWSPIPDSSQDDALNYKANVLLYTGSRGPGKTDTQLMRFRRNVGVGYGAHWRGVIFDREYKNLDDLVGKAKRWFPRFRNPGRFLEANSAYKWVWDTGEELAFRTIAKEKDYWKYHGQEYPFIGWNELTKYPTRELFDLMMSCNRSSFTEKDWPTNVLGQKMAVPPIPLEVFCTTNSYGPGHGWVKKEFIDGARYGEAQRVTVSVFNPATQDMEPVTRTKVAFFGHYKENIYLSKEYIASLITDKDKNRRKAWATGSWDVVAGGAFDDLWDTHIHVIPRFRVPKSWHVDRCFDWGSTQPFWCGWFAETNGEEIIVDGKTFCPPKGTLILIHELYGTSEIGSNKGLKWGATRIAEKIAAVEYELMESKWIARTPFAGPADNSIRDVKDSEEDTIEQKMQKAGIFWEGSDKSPGSRRNGFQLVRDRLEAALTGEGPGFYVMQHCKASTATVPVLPRDQTKLDDVDTDAEDHPYDGIRYRVLKGGTKYGTAKLKLVGL